MINWHLEPRSRRLLAQLNSGNVDRVTRVSIPADFNEYVGADKAARRVFKALEGRRTRAIERHLGSDFMAACADHSRRAEVISALEAAPDVSVVVGMAVS